MQTSTQECHSLSARRLLGGNVNLIVRERPFVTRGKLAYIDEAFGPVGARFGFVRQYSVEMEFLRSIEPDSGSAAGRRGSASADMPPKRQDTFGGIP
jgi:hypothetical protein